VSRVLPLKTGNKVYLKNLVCQPILPVTALKSKGKYCVPCRCQPLLPNPWMMLFNPWIKFSLTGPKNSGIREFIQVPYHRLNREPCESQGRTRRCNRRQSCMMPLGRPGKAQLTGRPGSQKTCLSVYRCLPEGGATCGLKT